MRVDLTRARQRVREVRGEGRERLWVLQTSTLERMNELLGRAPSVAGLDRLSQAGRRLVEGRLEQLTALPIEGYEELNARNASRAVRDLEDRVALRVVRRHEASHKNRKTVLTAVDEQLERLERQQRALEPQAA